jgi:hypothetical protein
MHTLGADPPVAEASRVTFIDRSRDGMLGPAAAERKVQRGAKSGKMRHLWLIDF